MSSQGYITDYRLRAGAALAERQMTKIVNHGHLETTGAFHSGSRCPSSDFTTGSVQHKPRLSWLGGGGVGGYITGRGQEEEKTAGRL